MDTEDEHNVSQSLARKLRLKELLDEGQQLDRELTNYEATKVLNAICKLTDESDQIINEGKVEDRAQHTTEVVMDAHVLKMNHELVSKVLQQNMEFNEPTFVNSINSIVNKGSSPDWESFAEIVCKSACTLNLHSTMLGAVEVNVKEKVVKQRQQRRRKELGEEKRPETVTKLKRQDKGAEKVNMIHRQLAQIFRQNNCQTMPFYKLIVDPRNFMNSVENAFQMAFLARDGVIGIETGEDGYPTVRLTQSAENKIQMDTIQWILSLDMDKCKKMARFYKIKEPLLRIQLEDNDDDDDEEEEYMDINDD